MLQYFVMILVQITCATKAIKGAYTNGSTVTYIPNNNAELMGANNPYL